MNVLIIPDSFKGSLSAAEVAGIMEKTVLKVFPKSKCMSMPFSDGGEGALFTLKSNADGSLIKSKTTDALKRPISAPYFIFKDQKTAWIELSQTAGLTQLKKEERNPLITSTWGTGLMILEALEQGCETIYLGIGGSATQDIGTGIIQALGGLFLDIKGNELSSGGGELYRLNKIDLSGLHPQALKCKWIIACDVQNTLIGKNGTAYTYAKQKGASNNDIEQLEKGGIRFAEIVQRQFGIDVSNIKGGGAAGGVGAGLMGLLGASLEKGFDLLASLTGLSNIIPSMDLILTGEGSFDEQSLYCKLPIQVATLAHENKIPVFILTGKAKINELKQLPNCKIIDCTPAGMTLDIAMANAAQNLEQALLGGLQSITN